MTDKDRHTLRLIIEYFERVRLRDSMRHDDDWPVSPHDALVALQAAETQVQELEREVARLKERLQIDPGGSDRIDELEQAIEAIKFRADDWQKVATDRSVEINRLMGEVARLTTQRDRNIQLGLDLGQILGPEYDGVDLRDVARELVALKLARLS